MSGIVAEQQKHLLIHWLLSENLNHYSVCSDLVSCDEAKSVFRKDVIKLISPLNSLNFYNSSNLQL